jgi:hypothetical protein
VAAKQNPWCKEWAPYSVCVQRVPHLKRGCHFKGRVQIAGKVGLLVMHVPCNRVDGCHVGVRSSALRWNVQRQLVRERTLERHAIGHTHVRASSELAWDQTASSRARSDLNNNHRTQGPMGVRLLIGLGGGAKQNQWCKDRAPYVGPHGGVDDCVKRRFTGTACSTAVARAARSKTASFVWVRSSHGVGGEGLGRALATTAGDRACTESTALALVISQ